MRRKLVSFAGSKLSIEYSGPRAAALVDYLYGRVPPGPGDGVVDKGASPLVYRLADDGRRLTLCRGETLLFDGLLATQSEANLADALLGDSCHHLAKESRGGLLFHAAALVDRARGRGLLFPGAIGAGKTTLAAWLALQGLTYLTDELVFVPEGADEMHAFPRPLNLKSSAEPALSPYFDFEAHEAAILRGPGASLIPPASLGSHDVVSRSGVGLLIFPRYVPNSDLVWQALSKAQAGLALMECLVNARNLPGHGFAEIARLARATPAYRLCYGGFDQLEDRLEMLLDGL
ncbi:MAG TPA: hypothetical protein ENN19_17010 [Chloroflexi bacterium]|nr:hypothetical protein [Chloroflexota bacterium]